LVAKTSAQKGEEGCIVMATGGHEDIHTL